MAARSGMREVKFKVRMNALLLCEFSTEQMVRITGLKPESVRTELQRMKQEGLLVVIRKPNTADQKRRRGGQSVLYTLVSDSEKRLALSRSVETFYPEKPRPPQPTSRHYHVAMHILDEAMEASNDRKQSLLNQAEEELDFALSEEGASRAPESVRAHIEFQRGRLAYLREQYGQAAESFSLARRALATAGQAGEVSRAEEFLLCAEIRRRWNLDSDDRPQARAGRLLEVLEPSGFQAFSPLVQLMTDLLRSRELSRTPQDLLNSAAKKQATSTSSPVTVTVREIVMTERRFQLEGAIQESASPVLSEPEQISYPSDFHTSPEKIRSEEIDWLFALRSPFETQRPK